MGREREFVTVPGKRRLMVGRSFSVLVRCKLEIDPLIGLGEGCLTIGSHDQGRALPGQSYEGQPLQSTRAKADLNALLLHELSVRKVMRIGYGCSGRLGARLWWAWMDLNPQPDRYERPALTIELTPRSKKQSRVLGIAAISRTTQRTKRVFVT
jgi:hypothetical protein